MLLTPDQEMIRDAVRDFAQRELWPHAAEWDKKHHFPKEAHKGLALSLNHLLSCRQPYELAAVSGAAPDL